MKYNAPIFQPDTRSGYFSTAMELSPVFNNFSVPIQKIRNSLDPNNNLIKADKRDDLIQYAVNNVRAFNYNKIEKRYRPYNIRKDAYDLNFFNYGIKEV